MRERGESGEDAQKRDEKKGRGRGYEREGIGL